MGKKILSIGKIILFVFLALLLGGVIFGRFAAVNGINAQAAKFEEFINTNHGNNNFVRNGLNFNNVSGESSEVNRTVSDIIAMLPSANDTGLPKFLYDMIINNLRTRLTGVLSTSDKTVSRVSGLTDSDGFLTVSSLINNIRSFVIKIVNIVFLVIVAVLVIVILIQVIKLLIAVKKEKKQLAAASTAAPAPAPETTVTQ